MLNQTPTSRFEETSTSALAVAILIFCENVKKRTKNVHLTSILKKTEIRDEEKNTIFANRDKSLVKKLFSFCKDSLSLERGESTKIIVKEIPNKIPLKDDQRFLLRFLLKNIEKRNPRPWTLGSKQDRIIDAKGKPFSYLSGPEYGLSFPDLENLIRVKQKIKEPEAVGQMVY
ncbi:MAG: hypothetical protein KBC11_00870 [Candidatus Pacebacteria bacterium]|nr:hypothetical protein [Candidatus Paceibacterota bacterium]